MYNFRHEIGVDDRYLRCILGGDYFHDSPIIGIHGPDGNATLQIELSCEREWRKCAGRDWCTQREEMIADPQYRYLLTFRGCNHIEFGMKWSDGVEVYLNGRFKDSVHLLSAQQRTHRRHVHLRIQAVGGYIDVVFRQFVVEKRRGKFCWPTRVHRITPLLWLGIKDVLMDHSEESLVELAKAPQTLAEDALVLLYKQQSAAALNIARSRLGDEDRGIWVAAVFVVGRLGDVSDLARLMRDNEHVLDATARRHRDDAAAWILHRCARRQAGKRTVRRLR